MNRGFSAVSFDSSVGVVAAADALSATGLGKVSVAFEPTAATNASSDFRHPPKRCMYVFGEY